jgi:hypothetical protein
MFSWPNFYTRTRHLEYLLENVLRRGANKVHFGGQECHIRVFETRTTRSKQMYNQNLIFCNLACVSYRLRSFISVAYGFVSIGHTLTPVPKTPYVLKDFPSLRTVPVYFHIWYPGKWTSPPFPVWVIILFLVRSMNANHWGASTDWRSPIQYPALASDNTYSVWFQKHCPEHLIANWRYSDGLTKGVHFGQF